MNKHQDNIRLESLATGYKSHRGVYEVSHRIDLSVLNGELVMLMGPNGCGKSTLMHTIAGLQSPLNGAVYLAGHELGKLRDSDRSKLLSLVLTDKITTNNLTVWDIVSIGRYPYVNQRGKLRERDKHMIYLALEQCNLNGFESRFFSELSDGEKQRVMIARALAQETPVMLLDEPTAHLDLPGRLEIMIMLKDLASKTGKSILVSTHELDLALQWADTVWLMNKHGDIEAGAPEDLILNGGFEQVFGNSHLTFDAHQGKFIVNSSSLHPIKIEGNGLRFDWTVNALHRNGYVNASDASCRFAITVRDEDWILSTATDKTSFDSIRTLIQALHAMSYPHTSHP
ncbi:ABC transporter ATP-binding protein [Porphyromonas pogonae]|uniref:ABC transporter ATP-binding protein n=1 Tax=Porphyromonas pogonae TaxID=867595 RepID=UPI002E761F73|nr:ABC transporter ATP-binding protein [Porphyromonas pogonae]